MDVQTSGGVDLAYTIHKQPGLERLASGAGAASNFQHRRGVKNPDMADGFKGFFGALHIFYIFSLEHHKVNHLGWLECNIPLYRCPSRWRLLPAKGDPS